jgi:CSLREA domain-containing protein
MSMVCLVATSAAQAAIVFTVNSTLDGVDDNPGNGICHTVDGTCTLRAAIMEANRTPNAGATILLPASAVPYTLQIFPTIAGGEENGDLNLGVPSGYSPGPTTITGAGADVTVIDANTIDRVLSVQGDGRSATISGVSMINGVTSGNGGGIAVTAPSAALYLNDCAVRNSTTMHTGGAIYNAGQLKATRVALTGNSAMGDGGGIGGEGANQLVQSTISGNLAASRGGGIAAVNAGTFNSTMDFTTISGNSAASEGSGIYLDSYGQLTLSNSALSGNGGGLNGGGISVAPNATLYMSRSTISGNSAFGYGGGISNGGSLFASNCTISGNSVNQYGGGISNAGTVNAYNVTIVFNQADSDADSIGVGAGIFNVYSNSTFNLRNSVIAGNYLAGAPNFDDCNGSVGIYGNNRFSATGGCSVSGPGSFSLVGSLAEFGVLKDNGGPTRTHALLPPSDLIDGAAICTDQNGVTLTTDQRGRPRSVGASCDIGAFEYDPGDIFASGFQ